MQMVQWSLPLQTREELNLFKLRSHSLTHSLTHPLNPYGLMLDEGMAGLSAPY